ELTGGRHHVVGEHTHPGLRPRPRRQGEERAPQGAPGDLPGIAAKSGARRRRLMLDFDHSHRPCESVRQRRRSFGLYVDRSRLRLRLRGLVTLLAVCLIGAACSRGGESPAERQARVRVEAASASRSARALSACGTRTGPPATYDHVVWVWMQNRRLDDVIGSPDAPFMNALTGACGVALNYSWVGHPTQILA